MPSQTRALITSMPVVAAVVAVIISVVVLTRWAERAGGMFPRLPSHLGADLDARPIVHPAVHARGDHLVERLRESRVGPHRRGNTRDVGVNGEAQRVGVEEALHGRGRGAAEAAMGGWILGMVGVDDRGPQARIPGGRGATAAGPNRGDRPPEQILVFAVPACDQSVRAGRREHREEARRVDTRQALSEGDPTPGSVPLEHRLITPETADVLLLFGR